MRIQFLLTILIISILIILNCSVYGLTLSKRIGTNGDSWDLVSTSTDGTTIIYNFTLDGKNLFQYKIERTDEDTIFNDLYLNITTTNPGHYTYINKYFSTSEAADAISDPKARPTFCPAWYANCGVSESYFSISLNNTITYPGIRNTPPIPMTIYVTLRDIITLCKQN
ncbi:hypothetical protein ACTA71_008496 [Dictyostelium dimigraforme]